jgi:hypothetical protein
VQETSRRNTRHQQSKRIFNTKGREEETQEKRQRLNGKAQTFRGIAPQRIQETKIKPFLFLLLIYKVYYIYIMKKLIDIPDEHIPQAKKIAKLKGQSVKSYMQQAVIAMILVDTIKSKK